MVMWYSAIKKYLSQAECRYIEYIKEQKATKYIKHFSNDILLVCTFICRHKLSKTDLCVHVFYTCVNVFAFQIFYVAFRIALLARCMVTLSFSDQVCTTWRSIASKCWHRSTKNWWPVSSGVRFLPSCIEIRVAISNHIRCISIYVITHLLLNLKLCRS